MRKTILTLLALVAGVVSATADNTVSVSEALIPQGRTGTFSIELTNTDAFASSLELHLTLPEGITFGSVALSSRLADNPSLSSTTSGQTVTITTLSGSNAAITGDSGPLLFITVSASADLEAGTKLTASITKMELAKKVGTKHEKWNPEPFDFEIEITDRVILDENSTIVPLTTDEEVDILVKRTVKAGQWSTICLPFDMTEEQIRAAFGDDVQIAELDIYDEAYTLNDDGTITVFFADADLSEGLYANWPYIIRTTGDISQFEVHARLTPAEEEAVAEYETGKGKNKKTIGSFTGTLHAGAVIPSECLFLSGNKFWYSAGKTVSKAFRAWFWFEDVLEDLDSAEARISLSFNGGETTGIGAMMNEKGEMRNEKVYDLQGRRVNATLNEKGGMRTEKGLKGIYVKAGKKIIIK